MNYRNSMQKEKIREGVELKGLKPDSWNFKMQKEMNLQIKRYKKTYKMEKEIDRAKVVSDE